jgi:hypothetical protein
MYINKIDEFLDSILNNFNIYLNKENAFTFLNKDINFVKFYNDIINYIKTYINNISKNILLNIIKKEANINILYDIIKRYCCYYIYLGIAYYYEGGRDLYITNIIEINKQSTYNIPNFYNSYNNSKIINFYNDIKNILALLQLKSIDKIKIVLFNNPLKYESTIRMFNEFGEDYITDYFLIKDNFHNIIKSLIFKLLYVKEDKTDIINMLQQDIENIEYKYLEIVVSNEKKIVDFNFIQKFLNIQQLKSNSAEEIYSYLEETKENSINNNIDIIDYLFTNNILIPITDDFVRYHKDVEKYLQESALDNIKERESTKIKYIMNKINNIKKYNSPNIDIKTKNEISNLFYKSLDPKNAVLYNDDEEIRIIQKLEKSENASDSDLLIDLLNIRKYAYVNFKDFKFKKLRLSKTISCIRATNINDNIKNLLDIRICNDNIDVNIIGIALNPSRKKLYDFNCGDLINVNTFLKEKNGYKAFTKIMKKTSIKKDSNISNDKIYYWLFDINNDILKSDKYISNNNNVNIMLEYVYNYYVKLMEQKFKLDLNLIKNLNSWNFDKYYKFFNKTYYNLELNSELKNDLIKYGFIDKIYNEYDNEIPYELDIIKKKEIIKLPSINRQKINLTIIEVGKKEEIIVLTKIPICYHYVKLKNINNISKKQELFNQLVFEFIKQYVRENNKGDKICKSCGEIIQIHKFIFDGSYSQEQDTFLTTSVEIIQNLEEIPKYKKIMRTIKNINKNIENIAYILELTPYLGNDIIIKLRRKLLTKDIIDLILTHTEWLKKQSKSRIKDFSKKYGINENLTNLFFFELKDEIFLTSSTDTDYYKIIKYNNIIIYLIFCIILEINIGQIINLKEDKKYNYILFEKIYKNLFNELYIRLNQKEKILIINFPIFAYILYVISGIIISKNIWLYKPDTNQNKQILEINLQKTIIHTYIDLINSIIEAGLEPEHNYLYELINNKLIIKFKLLFNDADLLNTIKTNAYKNIKIDSQQKITLLTKKINNIDLNIEYNPFNCYNIQCKCNTNYITIKKSIENNFINNKTNCENGDFHKWTIDSKNNNFICELCGISYNDIKYKFNSKTLYIKYLRNLLKKYCFLKGGIHEYDNNKICKKCNNYKLSDKQLIELFSHFNFSYKKIEIKTENLEKKEIIKIIPSNYNINIIINNFIDKLINIIGLKIKIDNNYIYLKDKFYIINHDYLGNKLQKEVYILESDNKINHVKNHPIFNKDILFYLDNNNKIYVYYDYITLQCLGYSDDNKTLKSIKTHVSLHIEYSIKDILLYLGFENRFINLYHINMNYINKSTVIDYDDIIINLLRNRTKNLKQIILKIQIIIYNIINNKINENNTEENKIIKEFSNKINKVNINNINYNDNLLNIYNISNIKIELINNYIDINNLVYSLQDNDDNRLLYLLILYFEYLLDNNKNKIDFVYLIIKLIKYVFNLYYIPYINYNILKFEFYLLNEAPYIDEKLKIVGQYHELLTLNEIDDYAHKEEQYNNNEENNALDIDDYEVDDDIDGRAEALDNDNME